MSQQSLEFENIFVNYHAVANNGQLHYGKPNTDVVFVWHLLGRLAFLVGMIQALSFACIEAEY